MGTSTSTTTPAALCAGPWDHCAEPCWPISKCCTTGYACTYSNNHWARCKPASSTSGFSWAQPARSTVTTTTFMSTKDMVTACIAPWEHCAEPGWLVPKCCTSGYTCVFANGQWARCQPLGQHKRSFLAVHHALIQGSMSSINYGVAPRP